MTRPIIDGCDNLPHSAIGKVGVLLQEGLAAAPVEGADLTEPRWGDDGGAAGTMGIWPQRFGSLTGATRRRRAAGAALLQRAKRWGRALWGTESKLRRRGKPVLQGPH